MAPRRTAAAPHSLSPQDSLSPNGPPSPGVPRSVSPSNGFAQFLAKPSKWFNRSASTSKVPSINESRPSLSSGGRKHKISRPTDPRPILDGYTAPASRSVLDLSARPQESIDLHPHSFNNPSSPPVPQSNASLGDLRNISRKAWSRSADDLSKVSLANFSPVKASFQDKIAEYRNRSESSASVRPPISQTSSFGAVSGRHAFPTISTPIAPPSQSQSTSPPRSSTLPNVLISPPIQDEAPNHSIQSRVHTRSTSSTPKFTSKLTPRFPPSPARKGTATPDRDVDAKENKVIKEPVATRGNFGFGLGGSSKAMPEASLVQPQLSNRQTTLLAPPDIVEVGQEDMAILNTKRSSQIVFNTGFINRLADGQNLHNANLSSQKRWKPYKVELKGSKLHFYKPPSDRIVGIKDLFPISLVPPSIEDEETDVGGLGDVEDLESRRGRGREESAVVARKKRAFWGRRTHPDLIRDGQGKIDKGTFEALTHESVFATIFVDDPKEEEQERESRVMSVIRHEEWKDFASSILLTLPSIVDRATFEAEFLRCCSYLVSGSDDDAKEIEMSRVVWLAKEYLRFHGTPIDQDAWDSWKRDTIPDVTLVSGLSFAPSGMPASASTQAIYQASPLIDSSSPNLKPFSPRPEVDAKIIPLLDALNGPTTSFASSSSSAQSLHPRTFEPPQTHQPDPNLSTNRTPWSALNEEGLSRNVLLQLDPHLISLSLTLFHRSVLDPAPENFTAAFVLRSESQSEDGGLISSSFSSLFGSDDQPHWLTKLILIQILGGDTSGSHNVNANATPGRKSEDRGTQTSRTHSRSEVISVWAKIGELCRSSGDECSWRAISAALCSRPVARLDKAWKRVDPQALAAIESWVYPTSDGEIPSIQEPRVTPWGGNIILQLSEELEKAHGENDNQMVHVGPLNVAKNLFEGFRTSFALCPRKANVAEGEIGEEVCRLVAFWRDMAAEGGGVGSLALKFQRVEQFMSLSLAVEPRRKGLFEPYHWSRTSTTQAPHVSLIPLLFPEALPTITLLDRSQFIRGRVDSDVPDIQYLQGFARSENHRNLQRFDMNQDITKRKILGYGGTVISIYGGDLLLVVQNAGLDTTPMSSRPPSSVVDTLNEKSLTRIPSIRVKPSSSQGLERKTSVARRSSLPSVSQRQDFVISELSSEPPLRVIVQAGTLNNLVSILVHGLRNVSVSVADDNGEMSLREGMTRELIVDRVEFAKVWWTVFRSFVTPLVFFELLRKLYITAQPKGSAPIATEYLQVASSRTQVLDTIREWIISGGGAQDTLDDVELYKSIRSFLDNPTDHTVHHSESYEEPHIRQTWTTLTELRRSVCVTFQSQIMRPAMSRGPLAHKRHGAGPRTHNIGSREAPDLDRMDPEGFVDNIDGMAFAAFSNVSAEDLYTTADLLEIQSADKTGWFTRDMGTAEEFMEIQTIYSQIQEVEPSSLISELTHDALYRLLPPSVRSCIRAYGILRKWLISKIVAPKLGLRARHARIELLLQAIEVARMRNSESTSSTRAVDQPCVRSFVEAVTTSAILSVESRLHHRAWQNVALNRGCQCDSLVSLLLRPYVQSVNTRDCLTVDIGWLFERMLEVIATPDVVDSQSMEGISLVNFAKRRQLCNLITKASSLPSSRISQHSDEANRRGFERLNNVEKEVLFLQFDLRGIKEEATREGIHAGLNGPASAKKITRPFHRELSFQMDKNRRDKNLRIRLQKEKTQEQARNDKRDDLLNRAMRPRKPSLAVQKQHRNKKSMSALFNFIRPISTAFGAETNTHHMKRTVSELDFAPSGKPALVLSIMDARAAQYINNDRSFVFQLDTEDGGHYLLQAMSKREMTTWLDTISRVTKMAAKRRLTYLGHSPKPQLADHIHDHPVTASRDPKAVFGVELEFLIRREAGNEEVPAGAVPKIIEECLSEVEARGLSEVGIYRIAGATSEINALKEAYNKGESPVQNTTDIHAVCDLIKSWFRVLPEPVFPSTSYHGIMEGMRMENLEDRLASIRSVVQALPQANFDLLRRVSEHLDRVTDFEEHNHMTAEALAIVFSPNLLRAPQNDFAMILANMGHTNKLVKALITHFHVIFDEADPEAEAPSDEEDEDYDEPILEEDENEEQMLDSPVDYEHA